MSDKETFIFYIEGINHQYLVYALKSSTEAIIIYSVISTNSNGNSLVTKSCSFSIIISIMNYYLLVSYMVED